MNVGSIPRLKRLLHPEQITTVLGDFAPLLGPEVALAVCDAGGRLLGTHGAFPPEVVQILWDAATRQPTQAVEEENVAITVHGAVTPLRAQERQVGLILATGRLAPPAQTRAALTALRRAMESLAGAALEKRAIARETLDRYREINLLYDMGETLATCLNVDELLERVLTEACQIIHAQQGAVLLYDERDELVTAASTGTTEEPSLSIAEGRRLAEEVIRMGRPWIANDYGPSTGGEQQKTLLAVPLRASAQPLGAIVLAGKTEGAMFTAGDEKLLSALSWQAAISLENARLFDSVRQQRDEIAIMKRYMDNIFASVTSGVITTNLNDIITTFNRAAEAILLVPAQRVINRPYYQALGFLHGTSLPALIEDVRRHHTTYVNQEISIGAPRKHQILLNVSVSTLQGSEGEPLGVAIVVDDVTEKRQYERERAMISRYLPHGLMDQLPHDLAELGLRGERQIITALFADIRGFTGLSEAHAPEWVMEVLNGYLTLAEAAVRFNQGIVDKYMGDAVMALFNTPLIEEEDHAWQAVQAAWALKNAVVSHHRRVPPEERLFLGTGICTGEAVVGNVGTEDRMEYTAIGDTVNLAKRIQETAQPSQIIISHETWKLVRDRVQVNPLPTIRVRGRVAPTRIYEVVDVARDT